MSYRTTASLTTAALLALGALAPTAAHADLQLTAPPAVFGTNNLGLNFFPGANTQAGASMTANSVTSTFTGDLSTSLQGSNGPGTYTGSTTQFAIIPFTISTLPVQIGNAWFNANFKVVASGGDGLGGGNDPVVNVTLRTRIYQLQTNIYQPASDPFISSTEFVQNYTQNGNGLQIIDSESGLVPSNFILTPGNYYMYQEISITTSYTSTGEPEPTRGMALEFGGNLTQGTYDGLSYGFGWATVPTPSAAAALSLGALAANRRRRN